MKTVKTVKTMLSLAMLFAVFCSTQVRGDETKAAAKTVTVKLKSLELTLPTTWVKSDQVSSMRLATYEIPAAEGDTDKGELSVFSFPGGGGGVAANLERWIGQFSSTGRKLKVTQGTGKAKSSYYLADISGTFNKPVGPPILRKTQSAPGYRMLAAIIVMENEEVFYLKLTGPEETMKAQVDAFRSSFGGDEKKEKPFEF